ncbi:helix-turn-helix domain-containing protein [Oceanobacillus sp. FSL K6-0118]|uniref:helix-turn-helix domain-containing protein n=1 Tax=Oceanobacillus sp. FSL K6-0118 TaxID=2921418 RepID=UPI0030FCB335
MTVYLADYQTFADKAELNYHVKQHLDATYEEINATDRNIFKLIARYAVKYAGASHLKVATIAEAVGKSVRTVNYVLKRLEGLGLIKRITRMRSKSGGNGANIIQILPYVESEVADGIAEPVAHRQEGEKPTEPTDKANNSEKEPLRKLDLKNTYLLDSAKAIKNNIPKPIYNVLSPFFNAKDLRKLTGIILRAKTSKLRIEDHSSEFESVILDVIRRYKERTITNLEGYLYKSIRKLSRQLFLTEGRMFA